MSEDMFTEDVQSDEPHCLSLHHKLAKVDVLGPLEPLHFSLNSSRPQQCLVPEHIAACTLLIWS